MKEKLLLAAATMTALLILPFQATASLGGDLNSVHDDQAAMRGTLRTTNKSSYNLHEIQAPDGTVLREFQSTSGTVFGIAWQGRSNPNLQQTLGGYYSQYVQAVKAQRAARRGHGPLLIQQPGFVVQMSGHMKSLIGKAYLPQNLPAGVRPEDIQ